MTPDLSPEAVEALADAIAAKWPAPDRTDCASNDARSLAHGAAATLRALSAQTAALTAERDRMKEAVRATSNALSKALHYVPDRDAGPLQEAADQAWAAIRALLEDQANG